MRDRVSAWVEACNKRLSAEGLPLSVAAYRNMWCICYHQKSIYNFLFHCYLRDAGLQLVWVGTGKALLNIEFSDQDMERLTTIIINSAKQFKADGWWNEQFTPPSLLPLVLWPTMKYHSDRITNWLGLGK